MPYQSGMRPLSQELDQSQRREYGCVVRLVDSLANYKPMWRRMLTDPARIGVNFLIVFIAYTFPSSLHRTAETYNQSSDKRSSWGGLTEPNCPSPT